MSIYLHLQKCHAFKITYYKVASEVADIMQLMELIGVKFVKHSLSMANSGAP